MRQTLFYIPHELFGVPVFGWGLVLAVWAIVAGLAIAILWRQPKRRDELRESIPVLVVITAAIVFLLPRLEAHAPDGTILGLPIRGYGMMLLIGVVTGVTMTVRLASRVGIEADTIYSLAFWMFVAGILGARVFYVAQDWSSFRRESWGATIIEVLKFTEGGLVVYGALIGGLVAFVAFTWSRRLPALRLADVMVPGMALGLAFGRIGCLLNGCCYGGESHWSSLSVRFPRYTCAPQQTISPPYWHQLVQGRLHGILIGSSGDGVQVLSVDPGSQAALAGVRAGTVVASISGVPVGNLAEARQQLAASGPQIALKNMAGDEYRWSIGALPSHSLPVHPTQLYSAIDAALIAFSLWAFFPLRPRDGAVFAAGMTVYPVTRFLMEMVRDDEQGRFGTPLTIAQIISLIALVLVSILWFFLVTGQSAAATASEKG